MRSPMRLKSDLSGPRKGSNRRSEAERWNADVLNFATMASGAIENWIIPAAKLSTLFTAADAGVSVARCIVSVIGQLLDEAEQRATGNSPVLRMTCETAFRSGRGAPLRPSRICEHREPSAHGCRLGMSGSIALKSSACTKRCASPSDRAPCAPHEHATKLMEPLPAKNPRKTSPAPYFQITAKTRRLRLTSARRVERPDIMPVYSSSLLPSTLPVFGGTNAALFP